MNNRIEAGMAFDHVQERPSWTAPVEKRLSWSMALVVIGACSLIGWAVFIAIVVGLLRLSGLF
jgi:hypothetical protein